MLYAKASLYLQRGAGQRLASSTNEGVGEEEGKVGGLGGNHRDTITMKRKILSSVSQSRAWDSEDGQ